MLVATISIYIYGNVFIFSREEHWLQPQILAWDEPSLHLMISCIISNLSWRLQISLLGTNCDEKLSHTLDEVTKSCILPVYYVPPNPIISPCPLSLHTPFTSLIIGWKLVWVENTAAHSIFCAGWKIGWLVIILILKYVLIEYCHNIHIHDLISI